MCAAGIATRAVATATLRDGGLSTHERIERDDTGGRSHIM